MPVTRTVSVVNPLDDLYNLIEKGTIQKEIVIEKNGVRKTYTLRSLFDEDYNWRDRFVNMDSPVALGASLRSPTLAIATVAIDGVPVETIEDLSKIDDALPDVVKDAIAPDVKYIVAFNLHTKVYSKLPRDYITDLYSRYVSEVEAVARNVTREEIKNSSASTPSSV